MPDREQLAKGTYALVLHLPAPTRLTVGRLGNFPFPAGHYLYLGSALGSGGLRARLARHARRTKRRHWHIDYLLEAAQIAEIWTATGEERQECDWARAALTLEGAVVPAPRFGASDCRCPAHLVRLPARPQLALFSAQFPGLAIFPSHPGRQL